MQVQTTHSMDIYITVCKDKVHSTPYIDTLLMNFGAASAKWIYEMTSTMMNED